MKTGRDTSWHKVGNWYNKSVGDRGHYYHEHVVLPGVMKLLDMKAGDSVLDLACGQGVLANRLAKDAKYVGIDAAASLISFAKKQDHNPNHTFIVGDVTEPLSVSQTFTKAAIVLAIQNIEKPALAIKNVATHLEKNGSLVIVLNHPAFRIPRQSSWETDEQNKLQYRRVNRYLSPLKIPITMHPGQNAGPVTWSFHEPISAYTKMLVENGFAITAMEEWTSDRESEGKAAKSENRARSEFPLFLAIRARLDAKP